VGIIKKHIAIICNYELLEDRVGGMDYFFWAFNKACAEIDITIDWFFPNIASHGDYHVFNIIPSQSASLEAHFINHIKNQNVTYDYIITHFIELCTSFFKDIPRYQTSNVIAVDHNPRPLHGYPLKKRMKKRIKGVLYSKYINQFIGVSEYTSQAIIHDFGSHLKPKVQTIYNGVLMDRIILKTSERAKVNPKFLVVSHLRESKGIQDLIRAVSLISENLKKDLTIDVYGDGPYKDTLFQLVEHNNLESVFNFKGSSSKIHELYQFYDYLIQPTHMECFSLSILESLSANVPVITTLVGGNVEVVINNQNGFLYEAKDSEALSILLTEIMTGKKYITEYTRAFIENRFSIEVMVANHIKLINTTH
jgi:glycosyltransferase involved in cell wall biosynthesis